jgi:hypothetical protein
MQKKLSGLSISITSCRSSRSCIVLLLGTDHLTSRGGGMVFFLKKKNLIPNVAEKNILILVEENKDNLIQSFCHIT